MEPQAPEGPAPASELAVEQVALPRVGDWLGERYELQSMLGRGGAGAVFRGLDHVLGHEVAIKILLPDSDMVVHLASMDLDLRTEAVASMRLAHPLIARVHHYERLGELEYLVMEFVPGRNLTEILAERGRPLSTAETVEIALDVLDALSYAHEAGIIHNDIKPRNIMRDARGMTKVIDFGLARRTGVTLTHTGKAIAGTAAYMCPERIRGEAVDHRGDLYSLAATLYALATGEAPFGKRASEALRKHVLAPLPAHPLLPEALYEVIRHAMAKEPGDRFESAEAFARALLPLREGATPSLSPPRRVGGLKTLEPAPLRTVSEPSSLSSSYLEPLPTDELSPPASRRRPTPIPPDMARIEGVVVSDHGARVEVGSFLLDVDPVTCAQYAAFLKATGEPPPVDWLGARAPAGREDHPVVGITIDEARAYARWLGRRLPTSAEWLAALRGREGRKMPWGNICNPELCACPNTGSAGTVSIAARPDNMSPEGVRGLLGNVWEWTENVPGLRPDEEGYHYVFGGSFRHLCGADTEEAPRTVVSTFAAYETLGFRCAMSAEEET